MDPSNTESAATVPFEEPLSSRFWPAFVAFVEEATDLGYFSATFGFQGRCGNQGGCDPSAFARGVQEHLGRFGWPIATPSSLSKAEVLSLVEFLQLAVSVPEWSLCGWCEQKHISGGDAEAACTTYEQRVNGMFERFNLPYQVVDGRVFRKQSDVLARLIAGTETLTSDPQLRRLFHAT